MVSDYTGRKETAIRKHVPKSRSPGLLGRILLEYHRLALAWQGFRHGRGRPVALRREADVIFVDDGARKICIPDVALASRYRTGLGTSFGQCADAYVGDTSYVPREGDVVVDIGAGIGEFVLWCADAGASVVAFEPDPNAYRCLKKNTTGLRHVRILPYALWKERADLRLHSTRDTLRSSLIDSGKGSARYADVEAWSLDLLPAISALPVIDFMKIDGQGVEPEILAGGLRTLRRTRVIAINLGAADRRKHLRERVMTILTSMEFRPIPHHREGTILVLNASMVGPFSSRGSDRPGS